MGASIDVLRQERIKLRDRRDRVNEQLTQLSADTAQANQKLATINADIDNIRDALATLGST